jgi:uncharacterized protein
VRFEWDISKSRLNQRKHGVSFEEAGSVFADEHRIEGYDEEHSETEDRFYVIGMSNKARLLVVTFTPRGENLWIISARTAGKVLEKIYEENR